MFKGIGMAACAAVLGCGFAAGAQAETTAKYEKHKLSFKNGEDWAFSMETQIQVRYTAVDETKAGGRDSGDWVDVNNDGVRDAGEFGPDATDDAGTFHIRRLKTGFKGTVRKNWTASFTYDWQGSAVEDAKVAYKTDHGFSIYAGRDKIPFNLQELTSSKRQTFVDRSQVSEYFQLDRSTGVWIKGKAKVSDAQLVRYAAGIFNGPADGGIAFGSKDRNANRIAADGRPMARAHNDQFAYAIGGRVEFINGDADQVGKYESDLRAAGDNEAFTYLVGLGLIYNMEESNGSLGAENNQIHATVDVRIHWMGLAFNGAYFMQSISFDEEVTVGGQTEDAIDNSGFLLQVSYNFNMASGDQVEVGARYNWIEEDDNILGNNREQTEWGIGANYRLDKHKAKVTADLHQRSSETSSNPGTPDAQENEAWVFRVQLQLMF